MSEWQPIETAPKIRENKILTYGFMAEDYGYSPEERGISVSEWCGNGWSSQRSTMNRRFNPTHWMPLPDPPK